MPFRLINERGADGSSNVWAEAEVWSGFGLGHI